ncbi:MAG: hypothetical protein LVQ97_01270 [Candidatus Micrarchaeales archaeon]|jgi:translation elongation factor EF-1beta|uniref:Elongation factor 1-beta n=1 Tax=Candidatus Micrarchaeum acidiphilum ARMAN-2 TaxID=425595 RepID=C7DHX8_MICA2|nr:MAG: translation elongation factor EF-1 beta subunit [Candidatus Micrarchaeum acidiphilum ARMAN-2]MCW6160799.1 hypothetical protein [Candidatus Micrarchaeales archaeon]
MAKVGIVYKVYPKDDMLESVVKNIKEKLSPAGLQTEDIAFGIQIVKAFFTFDDSEKSSSEIEESLKKLEGVSEVEVEQESLI